MPPAPPAVSSTTNAPPLPPAPASVSAMSDNSPRTSHSRTNAARFYQNTHSDPAWFRSHTHTVHQAFDRAPRTESVKALHVPLEHVVEASKKFYENTYSDPAWYKSHTHSVHVPLDKALPPYSSRISGKPSGPPEEDLPMPPPLPVPAVAPPIAPAKVQSSKSGSGKKGNHPTVAAALNDIETQDFYMENNAAGPMTQSIHSNERPRKTTRYLQQYYLTSPLEYSKDYVPPEQGGPPAPSPPRSRRHMNANQSNRIFHSDAVLAAEQEKDAGASENQFKNRNDRFSRRALRRKAADGLPEERYIPHMAASHHYLSHSLRNKDASGSGFVNFDEFKAALKQADVLLSFEEYQSVFDKFTRNSGHTQAPVPVRSSSSSAVASPRSEGPIASQDSSAQAQEQAIREQFKGMIGTMSAGKVLNISDFLNNVQKKAEHMASTNDDKVIMINGVPLPSHLMPAHKQKRSVFFKVLHSMNKSAEPARVFRHLDDEMLGHLRPKLLRKGLEQLGASLSDNEFSTLLSGIGYSDPQGQEFINLDSFDRVLHDELKTLGGKAHFSQTNNTESSDSALVLQEPSANTKASQGAKTDTHWEDFRRRKRQYTVPGRAQHVQEVHLQPMAATDTRFQLTDKITTQAAPSDRFAVAQASASANNNTSAATGSRLEQMRAILDCLQPSKSEFTRMIESKHTRDSSMKWCKLKSTMQTHAAKVLEAFRSENSVSEGDTRAKHNQQATAGANKHRRRSRSHSHSHGHRRYHGETPAARADDVRELSLAELETRLRNSGILLGSDDKAIMRFHLMDQARSQTGESAIAEPKEELPNAAEQRITLSSFCEAVGIPVTIQQSRFTKPEAVVPEPKRHTRQIRSTDEPAAVSVDVLEVDLDQNRDGGIFNSSSRFSQNTSDPTNEEKFNPTYTCSMFKESAENAWLKGLRKRRVVPAHALVPHPLEPWRFIAQVEHGSDAIWPTTPILQSTNAHDNGSFHFSRRHLQGFVNAMPAAEQAGAVRRAGRASSAPPGSRSRRMISNPHWADSDQFRASQGFAPPGQNAAEESERGRSRSRAVTKSNEVSVPALTSTDADKLRRWGSKPLIEMLLDNKADAGTPSVATTGNTHAKFNASGHTPSVAYQDSARLVRHTLRKVFNDNPNVRQNSTPFALNY